MLNHHYWARMWLIQEFILPKEVSMWCRARRFNIGYSSRWIDTHWASNWHKRPYHPVKIARYQEPSCAMALLSLCKGSYLMMPLRKRTHTNKCKALGTCVERLQHRSYTDESTYRLERLIRTLQWSKYTKCLHKVYTLLSLVGH